MVYNSSMSLPRLYSLQHCPYAMRARMGLLMAKVDVFIRAVVTKDKPKEMISLSPKATVPILLLGDGSVIDESLDIMIWALKSNDPKNLLHKENPNSYCEMLNLINEFDYKFRPILSAYKNAKRYHLETECELRTKCEMFIQKLESLLVIDNHLIGGKLSLADLAIMPVIRQFVNVDKKWFRNAGYSQLTLWLDNLLQSLFFTRIMRKYPLWEDCYVPANGLQFSI